MLNQASIDGVRHSDIPPQGHFIDGRTVAAMDGGMLDVVSPIDGRVLTQIADGSARDVDLAVTAARKAFDDGRWSRMPRSRARKSCCALGI